MLYFKIESKGDDIMRAIQMTGYGDVRVLTEADVATPEIKPKQVLVMQHATTIDPYDVKFRAGLMGTDSEMPLIGGSSVAGDIVAVGHEVTGFHIGDRVAANPHHKSYAEYVPVGQSLLAKIPDNVTYEQAAASALGAQAAYQAIYDALQLKPNESILIHGGAGSVGFTAIQFAKKIGATPIYTTASGKGADFLKQFDHSLKVIDYKAVRFNQVIDTVDKILDTVGGQTLTDSLTILSPTGQLVSTLGSNDDPRVSSFFLKSSGKSLSAVLSAIAHDNLIVKIAEVKPFNVDNLREFHDRKHTVGKLVLNFR